MDLENVSFPHPARVGFIEGWVLGTVNTTLKQHLAVFEMLASGTPTRPGILIVPLTSLSERERK